MAKWLSIGPLWVSDKEKVAGTGKIDLPCPVLLGPGMSLVLVHNTKRENEKAPNWYLNVVSEDGSASPPTAPPTAPPTQKTPQHDDIPF